MSLSHLTDAERLAGLELEQLQQLVGLVDYDAEADPFPVTGWDAVSWVVGNATAFSQLLAVVYGMEMVAYAGPETGEPDHCAYVLRSGAVRFVIQGGVSRPARCWTTTDAMVTACWTSLWRCRTSTGPSRTPAVPAPGC